MNIMIYCRNSLSDEDIRAMLDTVEPSQQVVDPCNKPQTFEDVLADLLNDPVNNVLYQNGTSATNGLNAFGISLLSEDLSVNSSMMSQGSMASDSSILVDVSNLFKIVFLFSNNKLICPTQVTFFFQILFPRGFCFFLFMKPRGSIAESRLLVSDVAKAKIFEATVLRELEAALSRVSFIPIW